MDQILYAQLPDDMVVIRVKGRGDHRVSIALTEVIRVTATDSHIPRYIFDLTDCETMDSTFMGVIAGIGLRQQRVTHCRTIATNMNPHVRELFNVLGLKFILEMRDDPNSAAGPDGPGLAAGPKTAGAEVADEVTKAPDAAFTGVEAPEVSKLTRTLIMLEAHEKLVDLDHGNEIRFKGVLQNLKDSLDRERGQNG